MKHTKQDLQTMQAWSLEAKIQRTQHLIMEWYEHFCGKVYVSFSGGKDSTVLLDLARRIYPDIEAVFVDTGLEYPEIREFVKTKENVTIIRPKMRFDEVIKEFGYPVISKEVSKHIYYYRKGSPFAIQCLNGNNKDGSRSEFRQRYVKWKHLADDAPFKISNKCCYYMKIQPIEQFDRESKKSPLIATMADESQQREMGWLKTGCNAFDNKKSKPMSFWLEQDILHYLDKFKIPYSEIYGEIETVNNQISLFDDDKLRTTGADRTGCMFCMFGVHLEKGENRFQRMKQTHPKQYDYCINSLGCGEVLDYINVNYK